MNDVTRILSAIERGDEQARQELLTRHRDALRRMVEVRLDRRLAPRLDPSDVVQETLVIAAERLDDYLRQRPAPFLAWLRQITQDRLVDAYRRHVRAERRTVTREEPLADLLPDDSVGLLVRRLIDDGSGPGTRINHADQAARVRGALLELPDRDREVLVMRYLEGLSVAEIAEVLQLGESAVKMRQLRALDRLRTLLLGDDVEGGGA